MLGYGDPSVTPIDLIPAPLGADAVIIPCSYQNSPTLCLTPSRLPLHLQIDCRCSLSRVRPFAIPWTAAQQASPSFTFSWNLLKLMSVESVMPPNHLVICCPLLLLPSDCITVQIMNGLEVASWHVFINSLEIRPLLEGLSPWGGDSGGHRAPCVSI